MWGIWTEGWKWEGRIPPSIDFFPAAFDSQGLERPPNNGENREKKKNIFSPPSSPPPRPSALKIILSFDLFCFYSNSSKFFL